MPRLLQSKRTLFIALSASALVVAAASGAYAGTRPASSPAGPSVYSGYHDAPITLPSSLKTIATLRVPAGNYAIVAKATVWNGENVDDTLYCKLVAGADFDEATTVLTGNSSPYADYATVPLNVVHHFASKGKINLQCTGGSIDTTASWIKITAIKAGSLSNHAIS